MLVTLAVGASVSEGMEGDSATEGCRGWSDVQTELINPGLFSPSITAAAAPRPPPRLPDLPVLACHVRGGVNQYAEREMSVGD